MFMNAIYTSVRALNWRKYGYIAVKLIYASIVFYYDMFTIKYEACSICCSFTRTLKGTPLRYDNGEKCLGCISMIFKAYCL